MNGYTSHIYTQLNVCMCVLYIHANNGIYSALKKNEMMSFSATQMDLEIIILYEVIRKGNTNTIMISLICGI